MMSDLFSGSRSDLFSNVVHGEIAILHLGLLHSGASYTSANAIYNNNNNNKINIVENYY